MKLATLIPTALFAHASLINSILRVSCIDAATDRFFGVVSNTGLSITTATRGMDTHVVTSELRSLRK